MSDPIIFYFDFSSSYSYIAQARVCEIEDTTGKEVLYRPIVLGAVFHGLGHAVPASDSVKMAYLAQDLKRCARSLGIDYQTPPVFPFNGIEAMRVFYALDADNPCKAREFAGKVFDAAYAQNQDMSQADNVAEVLSELNLERDQIVNAGNFNDAKAALKLHTQNAIDANVFGAPSFVYRDELFWGADRIDMLINAVNYSTPSRPAQRTDHDPIT